MAPKIFLSLNTAIIVLLAFFLIASPIIVDTIHTEDTLFLVHLGWRGLNGASPIIDYPHFYGGATAWFLTQAFALFGASYKSVDYGFAMLFGATALVLAGLCYKRITKGGLVLLLALAATLIMSLDLIESASPWTEVSHAFVYNHVGISLMLGLTVFTLREVDDPRLEMGTALLAGLALYGLILFKTTFGVMAISVILGCLVMGRARSAGIVGLGLVLGMLMMDPGMDRAVQSLIYLFNATATSENSLLLWFLVISGKLVITQITIVMLVCVLGWMVLRDGRPKSVRIVIAGALCAEAYFGAMLATNGLFDYKLYPMAVVLLIVGAEQLRREETEAQMLSGLLRALPACLAYMLIIPGLLSASYAYGQAQKFEGRTLSATGPLAAYHVVGRATKLSGARAADLATRRAVTTASTQQLLAENPLFLDDADEHIMRLDGVDLLNTIPNVRQYGIISNGQTFDFAASLLAKPVLSYSIWLSPGLPLMTDQDRLGTDVDIVMLMPDKQRLGMVSDSLLPKMADDFTPCRTSTFWTMHVRKGPLQGLC